MLEEVLNSSELTQADKKGTIGKTLRTLIANIGNYRVRNTFEQKGLQTIPFSEAIIGELRIPIPEYLQLADLSTIANYVSTQL